MNIFLDTLAGWQKFSNAPITEIADDGSTGGVLGESLSLMPTVPAPGKNVVGFYVPKFELDISKHFGERASLRADISFGRPASGGYINGIVPNHLYGVVRLTKNYNVEVLVGRFGLQAGYEPFRSYDNDTVSWSILWRSAVYPPAATGIQVSADLTDTFSLYLTAANGVINDNNLKGNTLPSFLASLEWTWGNEARPNLLVITPFIGPESGDNHPITVGGDITYVYWPSDKWKIGLEASWQRDNATSLGEQTSYGAALANIYYRLTPSLFTVVKYAFTRQFGSGNGVLNLTGAEQNIHEASLACGYQLTDFARLKAEFRFDIINPDSSKTQYIPGFAIANVWKF